LLLGLTVIGGLIVGLGCVTGGIYLLVRTGKIHSGALLALSERTPAAQVATHTVSLDPILVNLADPSGHAYLRLGLALAIEDSAETTLPTASASSTATLTLLREREIPIRDTVLTVLGQQSSSALLEPGGKDRLKQELQAALALHNPDLKVRGLYFSDFLVQP
jgi:flagellar FliL protein